MNKETVVRALFKPSSGRRNELIHSILNKHSLYLRKGKEKL